METRGPGRAVVEAVVPDAPRAGLRPLLTQRWRDLAMLHWAVDPAAVAPLLPVGTVPDVFEGVAYVGLIAFRMEGVGFFRLPGVPYFGTFAETNVRLYSVDERGRRAVVFRSLEASRLVPVLVARAAFRLPYMWARMRVLRDGPVLTYTSGRRWPGPVGAAARIRIRAGERIAEPSPLDHFLTARWALHTTVAGRLVHLPNAHPRWSLHRAELLECRETLIGAEGLPAPVGPPASVLYSPGVPVRFGRPDG
ncbi:DUF2071 domain-containing protein [Streptomyces sp. DW26H14]|uniref:DUF2071 domain-containing protein n=1 Tax=Streptomyces sp. DW26H14 TaxID=3435395 RepID=UPI00403E11D9